MEDNAAGKLKGTGDADTEILGECELPGPGP